MCTKSARLSLVFSVNCKLERKVLGFYWQTANVITNLASLCLCLCLRWQPSPYKTQLQTDFAPLHNKLLLWTNLHCHCAMYIPTVTVRIAFRLFIWLPVQIQIELNRIFIPYLGRGSMAQWQSTCFACERSRVQSCLILLNFLVVLS